MSRRTPGVTLVEILIVIVVIGILSAVATVYFVTTQQRAKDVTLRSDLNQAVKTINIWMLKSRNSVASLRELPGGALWVVGSKAQNNLPESTTYWNSISALPKIDVTAWTSMEIIPQYSGTEPEILEANSKMLATNQLCITAQAPGSSYDYVPWSMQHQNYNKILYYDGLLGGIYTIEEISKAYDSGKEIVCAGHLMKWRAASP